MKESTEIERTLKYGSIRRMENNFGMITKENGQRFIFTWHQCGDAKDQAKAHAIFNQLEVGMPVVFEECTRWKTPDHIALKKATNIKINVTDMSSKNLIEATSSQLNDLLV